VPAGRSSGAARSFCLQEAAAEERMLFLEKRKILASQGGGGGRAQSALKERARGQRPRARSQLVEKVQQKLGFFVYKR